MMAEVLAKTTFSSVIHNNEVCDEIVKWGNANGYPVTKAKLQNKLEAYVGFSPEYMILAKRLPPIPGGWDVRSKAMSLKNVSFRSMSKPAQARSTVLSSK